jgi:hypothetical protein
VELGTEINVNFIIFPFLAMKQPIFIFPATKYEAAIRSTICFGTKHMHKI